MRNNNGGISDAGVQAIIYFAIGLAAFVLVLAIMTSVMGSNVKKKKSITETTSAEAPDNEKLGEEIKAREEIIKLVEEIKTREEIIKLFNEITAREETSNKETDHSKQLTPNVEIMDEKIQPIMEKPPKPKKHRKIKMPRNTGGG